MEWILLGLVPVGLYWWFFCRLGPWTRRRLVANFFTAVVLFAVAGIVYELVTTGTFAVTPQD